MIKLKLKLEPCQSTQAVNAAGGQIDRLYLGLDKLYATQNATNRIDNISGIKISGSYLVQHRREQNKVLAADQRYVDVIAAGQRFIQVHRRA